MEYEELKKIVMDYFGDTSRSQGQTREDLLSLSDECQMLAESLEKE